MKRIILFWLMISIVACSKEKIKTKPEEFFTQGQIQSLLLQIVKKTAKKPESSYSEAENQAYYSQQLKQYQWHFAFKTGEGFYYFVSRPAPSLYGKRTGMAGFFSIPDGMNIRGFREDFHLFKMKPEEMVEKGGLLFEKLINQENLMEYYPQNQKNEEEWIEFPDNQTVYDSTAQAWKTN